MLLACIIPLRPILSLALINNQVKWTSSSNFRLKYAKDVLLLDLAPCDITLVIKMFRSGLFHQYLTDSCDMFLLLFLSQEKKGIVEHFFFLDFLVSLF